MKLHPARLKCDIKISQTSTGIHKQKQLCKDTVNPAPDRTFSAEPE